MQRLIYLTALLSIIELIALPAQSFQIRQIAPNYFLNTPWELNYGPDDHLWITERTTGTVLRVDPETANRDVLIQIPEVSSTAGQDGLLGLALHPNLLTGTPHVYVSYTYLLEGARHQKLVRYTYTLEETDGSLADPMTLIEGLPASNDHNSGRLVFGPDEKLYYTIGDQGGNQLRNYCNPILSQALPTQEEVDLEDWRHYPGKVLRLNPDGSIPDDNPELNGVRSHIYTYGHRNAQGLVFGKNGLLYSDEHGPNTDDEVNLITAGQNYGWPRVVGFRDDQAYDYCNWSSVDNCASLTYSNGSCPDGAAVFEERSFREPNYEEPLFSLFAVPDEYDFDNPACGNSWICRPNVAPSSLAIYESDVIPEWQNSLLISSLKRGRIYRLQLNAEGTAVVGDTSQYFYSRNRYRDLVVAPDGRTLYVITDATGRTATADGLNATNALQNPGTILKFTLEEAVSVADLTQASGLRIWPNPVPGKLNLELPDGNEQNRYNLTLFAPTGQILRQWNALPAGVQSLQLTGLPSGMHVLKIGSGRAVWYQRIYLN